MTRADVLNKLLDHEEVVELLRAEIAKAGNQSRWAVEKKVSRSNVNRILTGRIKVQNKILDALGLERVDFYAER